MEAWDGHGHRIEPQRCQVFGAALLGDRRFEIGQQSRARFRRPRLGLFQRFAGKLNIGIAFGRDGNFHSAFQAELQGSRHAQERHSK